MSDSLPPTVDRFHQPTQSTAQPRVLNMLRVPLPWQVVLQQLQQLFPSSSPYVHPLLDTAVILPGQGPNTLDLTAAGEGTKPFRAC